MRIKTPERLHAIRQQTSAQHLPGLLGTEA
jgi:hypothetical protein